MVKIDSFTEKNPAPAEIQTEITRFLFQNLEQYGDPESDIRKCLDYAFGKNARPGGHVFTARHGESGQLAGAVVLNKTGMASYIPENILVYIATDKNVRGQGVGRKLMQAAIDGVDGDIALHCEPDNPARHLYEKLGFSSKYLEMRLKK